MQPLSLTPPDSLAPLDSEIRRLLIESAPLHEEWARSGCARKDAGGMEEWAKTHGPAELRPETSCEWYHGTWQYLRLLNMVATPPWYEFYNRALSKVLRERPKARVLISAAADFGMLQTLHEAILTSGATPKILVYDICQTPLRSCQWYAERHGLEIECIRANLLTCDIPPASFDLIVTDEFLTVIKGADKPVIVDRWRHLLKPGGTLVTTAMIGHATTPELRQGYAERARYALEGNLDSFPQHTDGRRGDLIGRFDLFASHHTRHMLSGEEEIVRLFQGFKTFSYERTETPGECVNPTFSFQIVASMV